MAKETGGSGVITIDDSPVLHVRDWTLDGTGDTVEDSTIGVVDRTYKPTMKSHSVSLTAYYDQEELATEPSEGDVVDLELYPSGETVGDNYFTMSAIVSSKSRNGSFDGMIELSMSFQVSGPVTEEVVAVP